MDGVFEAEVGYIGGHLASPDYRTVCSGTTGHAEAVRVHYDAQRVSYEQLLEIFWANHDPTQVNRQGPNVGSQYRSVVFFHSPEQEQIVRASMAALDASGRLSRPVATEIVAASDWWRAEEYHQNYYQRNGIACPTPR